MRGFRVGSMTTCRCCGQVLPPCDDTVAEQARVKLAAPGLPSAERRAEADVSNSSISVDEELLQICNRAHADAERRGSEAVEISHVAILLTWRLSDEDFSKEQLSRRELARAAEIALSATGRDVERARPRTSAELRVLLVRAEAIARAESREFASPHDFLRALAHRSRDLVSARFVPDARTAGFRNAADRSALDHHPTHGHHWREPRQGKFDFERRVSSRLDLDNEPEPQRNSGLAGTEGAGIPVVRHHQTDLPQELDTEYATRSLMARIERQEQMLSGLTGLVARLVDEAAASRASQHDISQACADSDEAEEDRPAARASRSGSSRRGALSRLRRRSVSVGGTRLRSALIYKAWDRDETAASSSRHSSSRRPEAAAPRTRAPRNVDAEFYDRPASADLDAPDDGDGQGDRMKRFYLSPGDDIVKAPSIGPRTAARLIPAGLVLVRDLLVCDPADVAARVGARYITADRIADWKAQARLVCTIPWLRGTHAQLLVGAGYDTIGKLQRADASNVCAAILRFAATREGQSILRSGPPPEIDRIACWIENTALAEPARAA